MPKDNSLKFLKTL